MHLGLLSTTLFPTLLTQYRGAHPNTKCDSDGAATPHPISRQIKATQQHMNRKGTARPDASGLAIHLHVLHRLLPLAFKRWEGHGPIPEVSQDFDLLCLLPKGKNAARM